MRAFENTPVSREQFIEKIDWHVAMDKVQHVGYGDGRLESFRGCAVGCSINSFSMISGENLRPDAADRAADAAATYKLIADKTLELMRDCR